MVVKIVTESASDVPPEIVEELGITIIPINISFGIQSFRDGVDLTAEQFYQMLAQSQVMPTTAVPPPSVYAEACDRIAEGTDEIVIITISREFSASNEVALQARKLVKHQCRVEVIDSRGGAMAEGLIVITAAKAAKAGASLDDVVKLTRHNISRSEIRMAFDTLEYLKRGGRIGPARALFGSMLRINPVLAIKDGKAYPSARPHSRARAIDNLYDFVANHSHIDELAVEDATTPGEADFLVERLSAKFPRERIYRSRISPVVGAHVGPHVLAVAVLGDK